MTLLRVGLLVNPVAGLGGPGAYKGSDLDWREALARGYVPPAPERAARLVEEVGDAVAWRTLPGAMGVGDLPRVDLPGDLALGRTSPEDTRRGARALRDAGVDLLCFVGGDGTATDVAAAVDAELPCLGVPAGVKVTSAVFAHDVEEAAWLLANLADRFESVARDVTDLDEAAYRAGRVQVRLTGTLLVPRSPAVQGGKVATTLDTPLDPIVDMALEDWDPQDLHLIGAGSVCLALKKRFWGEPTLLGLDAVRGDRIVATDLDDRRTEALLDEAGHGGQRVHLVLSPIGGQGMLIGRGTQMLRPDLLRRIGWERLRVIAPPEKLLGLRGLHVDSGDPAWDEAAPGHIRVITGWNETRLMRVLHGADVQPS